LGTGTGAYALDEGVGASICSVTAGAPGTTRSETRPVIRAARPKVRRRMRQHWPKRARFGRCYGKQPSAILGPMPTLIPAPTVVEAAGNKPKLIREYVGRANTGVENVSIAHM